MPLTITPVINLAAIEQGAVLEPLPVDIGLMGASLVTQGQEASKYLAVLEAGDLDRLRRMLETSIDIGNCWATRLADGR